MFPQAEETHHRGLQHWKLQLQWRQECDDAGNIFILLGFSFVSLMKIPKTKVL